MRAERCRHAIAGAAVALALALPAALRAQEMDCARSADGRQTICVPRGASMAPPPAAPVAAPRSLRLYLAQLTATRDPRAGGAGIGFMGTVLARSGQPATLPMVEQALAVDRQSGFVRGQLSLLNQIAGIHLQAGDLAAAATRLAEALALARRENLRDAEGATLANTGVGLALKGDYAAAIRATDEAAQAYAAVPAAPPAAPASRPRGAAALKEALAAMQKPYAQGAGMRDQEVEMGRELCLLNLGTLHAQLGQYPEAAARYDQALALYPNGKRGAGTALRAKADLLRMAGRGAEAAPLERQAEQAGDSLLAELGQNPTIALQRVVAPAAPVVAVPAASSAAPGRQGRVPPTPVDLPKLVTAPAASQLAVYLEAATRNTENGHAGEALANWRHAAAMAEITESGSALVAALAGLQQLALAQGDAALSIHYGKRAVDEIQRQRRQMGSLDRNVRNAYATRARAVYEALASSLMDAGRLAEAELALRLMREDASGEIVAGEPNLPANGAEAALREHERAMARDWKAVVEARRRMPMGAAMPPLNEEAMARIRQQLGGLPGQAPAGGGSPSAACLRTAPGATPVVSGSAGIDVAWCNQVQGVAVAERVAAPPAALLQGLKAGGLRFDPAGQAALDAGTRWLAAAGPATVSVQYLAGPRRLQILLVGARGRVVRESAVTRDALEGMVDRFLEAMNRRDPDIQRPAQELHRLLIDPIQASLRPLAASAPDTLMFSLDGRLRYLPMAALHDGKQWLAERHALAIATPAQLPAARAPARPWRIAGFGSTRGLERLQLGALPGAGREIAALVRDGGAQTQGLLPGIARLDADFTAEALKSALEQHFPVVHLATHFVLGDAEGSYLLLGDGSTLPLQTLRRDFRFDGVDLVTLSACETARDARDLAWGQEFEGLSAALRAQGAGAVLATLWKVDDATTASFMRDFYGRLAERTPAGKAGMLRQAQKQMIEAGRKSGAAGDTRRSGSFGDTMPGPAAQARLDHPFYWAPFVLLGDVR